MLGFQRDYIPLAESRGGAFGGVWGKAPLPQGAPQRVNFKTVRWTVLKERTPCKRGRSLKFILLFGIKKRTHLRPLNLLSYKLKI